MKTKSYTYNPNTIKQIHYLARNRTYNERNLLSLLKQKLSNGLKLEEKKQEPSFDDIVFLPANLTRLVIDPYREKCNTATIIGKNANLPLKLDAPIVVMSEDMKNYLFQDTVGLRVPLETPTATIEGFSAVELEPNNPNVPLNEFAVRNTLEFYRSIGVKVPIGITIGPNFVARDVKVAVELGLDFVTLSAVEKFTEDKIPKIEVLTEAVEALRLINHEEDIDILYFGGIRSGADIAKAIALGANAVIIGTAARIAIEGDLSFNNLTSFISALVMETSMLTCCCGKTDVHNLEPEDLRSLTIETSKCTGIPVVGKDKVFR